MIRRLICSEHVLEVNANFMCVRSSYVLISRFSASFLCYQYKINASHRYINVSRLEINRTNHGLGLIIHARSIVELLRF